MAVIIVAVFPRFFHRRKKRKNPIVWFELNVRVCFIRTKIDFYCHSSSGKDIRLWHMMGIYFSLTLLLLCLVWFSSLLSPELNNKIISDNKKTISIHLRFFLDHHHRHRWISHKVSFIWPIYFIFDYPKYRNKFLSSSSDQHGSFTVFGLFCCFDCCCPPPSSL